jgi:hypothetical protein
LRTVNWRGGPTAVPGFIDPRRIGLEEGKFLMTKLDHEFESKKITKGRWVGKIMHF